MAKYKNTKQIAKSAKKEISDSKLHKYLIAIPLIALVIKFIVMGNIQSGMWLGADGENYLKGLDGLVKDGFFSKEGLLSYWPAGYPLLMWPLAEIAQTAFFYLLSIIQSIFSPTRHISSPAKWQSPHSKSLLSGRQSVFRLIQLSHFHLWQLVMKHRLPHVS